MAIFSRRTLQRLLNENSTFLTLKQTKDHIKRLDSGDIGVEWEILLLNVFSKLGTVEHEKNFNGKNPDLYFTSHDHILDFLSDIKTVSDEGTEIKNPQEYLIDRLHDEVLKYDIRCAWRVEIDGNHKEARRHGKMTQLKLPALARFDAEIFNESFEEFALLIQKNPNEARAYQIKTQSVDLTISYQPSDRWVGSGSYPSYKSIELREHLIQNSIYSGLVSKADQLKGSAYNGALGIILCDGGSDFLPRSRNIIQEFFRAYPYINFVLAFRVEQNFGLGASNQVIIYFEKGPGLSPKLEDFFSTLHTNNLFPYPVRSARNARYALKSKKPLRLGSFYGGCTMSGNEIKLSVRTILDLLAGKITYDDFPETYKVFFADRAAEGRLFEHFEIEKAPDEKDDDWLTMRFGKPDPAVAPFKVPERNK